MSDAATNMTFATALFLLRRAGVPVQDAALEGLAAAIDAATDPQSAHDAATRLAAALDSATGPQGSLGRAFPGLTSHVVQGDRQDHVAALRRARFGSSLPMLAAIADRFDGGVGVRWALVLDVGEDVSLLDPNPWDDVAEDRHLPLGDFAVRWELAGSQLVTF
jgi:hypothetical protein